MNYSKKELRKLERERIKYGRQLRKRKHKHKFITFIALFAGIAFADAIVDVLTERN